MLTQQILGIINLAIPVIVLFNLWPAFLAHAAGPLICALLIGTYLWYLNRRQLHNLVNSLRYEPTNQDKDLCTQLIRECQLRPATINVRYAYTAEQIAMMAQHTVIIDPVVWHTQSEDQEALKVKDIFAQHIEPALSQTQKQRLDAIKQLLTPAAQRFIFKHELGHSAANFSKKKLGVIFIVGFLATYSGITAAKLVLPINGLLAILVGMLVGGFCDLLYTYLSNATWKLRQEKNADFFAARYSSREDIQAAAHFFAHHQEVLATYREPGNLLARIPSAFTSGHQNGKARSAFLLKLAELNQ